MEIKITNKNVVIVAHQFNPSIVNQLWLVKNGILSENDFDINCVFTPVISQTQAHEFTLLILPEQLQFAPKLEVKNDDALVFSKVGRIIEKLPHTPFSAAGLNFIWHISAPEKNMGDFTKSLFWRDNALFREFDYEDARFGAYLSKNVLGSRLKLDIKPVFRTDDSKRIEILQFAFNYHVDLLGEKKVNDILELLKQWNDAKNLSERIIMLVGKVTL